MTLGGILLMASMLALAVTVWAAMVLQFREHPPAGTLPALGLGALTGMCSLAAYIAQA